MIRLLSCSGGTVGTLPGLGGHGDDFGRTSFSPVHFAGSLLLESGAGRFRNGVDVLPGGGDARVPGGPLKSEGIGSLKSEIGQSRVT